MLQRLTDLARRPWFWLCLLPLIWLWFRLIDCLRIEWTVNPQYGYGWAVPFLCGYLLWQRIQTSAGSRQPETDSGKPQVRHWLLIAGLALLYLPTRLIQVANPDWRLVSWALAVEVVGLTLCVLRPIFSAFRNPASVFVFPVCYFFVAVPWPTVMEGPLVQALSRLNAGATVAVVNLLGVPALQHGNVIEIANGFVGIEEACSGLRSFQATLMISLFLGELYRLPFSRRLALCLAGFALALGFNLARTSLLVEVAARRGLAAIHAWHDPAGVTILVACFFSLWGLGLWWKKPGTEPGIPTPAFSGQAQSPSGFPLATAKSVGLALTVWMVATEAGVEFWYRSHETKLPPPTTWTVAWPTNNPTFKEMALAEITRQYLRYDEGQSAVWTEAGQDWQVIFLSWRPGQTAQTLARNHTPEVCLPAAGHSVTTDPELHWLEANGLRLPFRVYQTRGAGPPLWVYYCLWDDRASVQGFETAALTARSRLDAVAAARRNTGMRSIELVVRGVTDASAAESVMRQQLARLIHVN